MLLEVGLRPFLLVDTVLVYFKCCIVDYFHHKEKLIGEIFFSSTQIPPTAKLNPREIKSKRHFIHVRYMSLIS